MKLYNGKELVIREYRSSDYSTIAALNQEQGWKNFADRPEEAKAAWEQSPVRCIAESEGQIIGYVRGLTDGFITLYVCEILVKKSWRKQGVGRALLNHVHSLYPAARLELLATGQSYDFYENAGYRMLYGFRKSNEH
ncbi:GNAT family N-acetyltransferase [Bacillus sp. H-16]|nr:GNAT family N-acetyltransferase [Alteribacter salitolerans]